MAQVVADRVRALGDQIGTSITTNSMTSNKKIADLEKDMKDAHSKQNTTTDFGTKVTDLDHWLKTVDEKNGTIGPHML